MRLPSLDFIAGWLLASFWFYAYQRGWHRNLLCRIGWHGPRQLHTLTERNNADNTAFPYSVAEMERCPRCGRMKVFFWYEWEKR